MMIREAIIADIEPMHAVRIAVKENRLNTPGLVKLSDYEDMLTGKGKGWVCETGNDIVGFAVVNATNNNVWALFVSPEFEGKGIGRQLHDTMLNWCFAAGIDKLWLTTDPETRAAGFYRKAGWVNTAMEANGEMRFELTRK